MQLKRLILLMSLIYGANAWSQFQYEEDPYNNQQEQFGDFDIQTRPLNFRSTEFQPLEAGILKTVQDSTGQRLVGLTLKQIDLDVVSLRNNNGYNTLTVEADGQVIEQQYLSEGQQTVRVRLPYPQEIGGQGLRRLVLYMNGNQILGSIRLRVSDSFRPGPGPGPRPDPDQNRPIVIRDKILSSFDERISLDELMSRWQEPSPYRLVRQLSISARSYGGVFRPGGRLMVIVRGRGNVLSLDISNSSRPQSVQLPSTPLEDITFRVIGSDIYLEQMIIR